MTKAVKVNIVGMPDDTPVEVLHLGNFANRHVWDVTEEQAENYAAVTGRPWPSDGTLVIGSKDLSVPTEEPPPEPEVIERPPEYEVEPSMGQLASPYLTRTDPQEETQVEAPVEEPPKDPPPHTRGKKKDKDTEQDSTDEGGENGSA